MTNTNINQESSPLDDKIEKVEKHFTKSNKKTNEEDILNGLSINKLRKLALYLLLNEHPFRNQNKNQERESMLTIENFLNRLNIETIRTYSETDKSKFDLLLWCKEAVREINTGTFLGGEFLLDSIDEKKGDEFIDIINNVKEYLPIGEIINNTLTPDKMLNLLPESECVMLINYIQEKLFVLDVEKEGQMNSYWRSEYEKGNIGKREYLEKRSNLYKEFESRFTLLDDANSITKSALDTGFTAGLPEDECRRENQRNLKIASL